MKEKVGAEGGLQDESGGRSSLDMTGRRGKAAKGSIEDVLKTIIWVRTCVRGCVRRVEKSERERNDEEKKRKEETS